MASKYSNDAVFSKVETGTNPELTVKYGVMTCSTFKFFKNGKVIDELSGSITNKTIRKKINEVMHKFEYTF
jgi:thiol-disulfide isomerase/thioredoxin